MGKIDISVVIPVFNEAETVVKSLPEIRSSVDRTALSYEILIIDDGSTDGTWDILRGISQDFHELRAVRLSRNFGKECAIAAGLRCASGEAVILMDADLQHPPELIPLMVKGWKDEKYDIVEGIKANRGNESFSSKIGAKLFYTLMKKLSGIELENSSDFKLLDRKVVDAHNSLPESSRFFRGIVSWLGFRKKQISFPVGERVSGNSRWSVFRLVRLAIHASSSFSSLPLHIVTLLGMVTLGFSIVLGIQTLYMKFSGAAVSGFTTVILLLLSIGSVLMISLGIIGVYISRIFDEVKGRPRFIVEDVLNMEFSTKETVNRKI